MQQLITVYETELQSDWNKIKTAHEFLTEDDTDLIDVIPVEYVDGLITACL